ncbi:unnamed protein product [Phyllotreta striolata]|uniref:Ig-like domain-containing protein n=1 Tax=Phyllotreta striolata TaxID=444603 RepID=A0A9N9TUV3_PHYSR|nr:unnamed protein product [Phyllotreta striolata]
MCKKMEMTSEEIVRYFYFTLFVVICSLCDGCGALKEMKINVPEAALSGDTVTLACDYNLEEVALYSIKWYWNDEEFYRFVPKESPPFRAFTVTFADFNVDISNSGSTRVTLRNISREMTGDYKCEVSADAPRFHTDIQSAHMIVIDAPRTNPTLDIEPLESAIKIEIGKTLRAECSAPGPGGAHLSPNITWFLNDKQIIPDEVTKMYPAQYQLNKALNVKLSKSKIEIKTGKSHFKNGVLKLKCQASLFSIWKNSVDRTIKEDSPLSAPVLGSTSSQSHTDQVIEIITSSAKRSHHTRYLYIICSLGSLLYSR